LKENVAPAELKVAKLLIDSMSVEQFEPQKFHDQYRDDVMAMIDARAAGSTVETPAAKRPAATNVVNLMDVLQRSLEQSQAAKEPASAAAAAPARKKSAPAAKPKRKKSAA
jgi:DNA end-binding protein Ku